MVRMGKVPKGWSRSLEKHAKKYNLDTPSTLVLGGRVHPSVLSRRLVPLLTELSIRSSEEYATKYIEWSSSNEEESCSNESCKAIKKPEANIFSSQSSLDEFSEMLREVQNSFLKNEWKVKVNAAKFQRRIDERYGYFLPLVKKYPELEVYVKYIQRKHYSLGKITFTRQGPAPLNKTTCIIFLFLMHRQGVRTIILILTGLFLLVGLQPWALVCFVCLGTKIYEVMKNRTKKSFKKTCVEVTQIEDINKMKEPVGEPLMDEAFQEESEWDAIVLGSGIETLYAASLLSRCGKKVLVLSPNKDASGNLIMNEDEESSEKKVLYKKKLINYPISSKNIPFDITAGQIGNIHNLQSYLAPALATKQDLQGGVRFTKIGNSSEDGNAFLSLSIPGLAEDNPIIFRPGIESFLEDLNYYLNPNSSDFWSFVEDSPFTTAILEFLKICSTIYASSAQYFISKVLPSKESTTFGEASIRSAGLFLKRYFHNKESNNRFLDSNFNVCMVMAAIATRYEDISSYKLSMGVLASHLHSIISGDGFYYPIGGMRCLAHALQNVIKQHDGKIYTGVKLKDLIFDQNKCVGIQCLLKKKIVIFRTCKDDAPIVSTLGFINTYIKLLPDNIRTTFGVPEGLPSLSQKRPVFKLLLLLEGNAKQINLPSFDYFRLPSASKASFENEGLDKDTRKKKYDTGYSYLHVCFPSVKDPAWAHMYGNVSTCVISIEADDDFVKEVDTKPVIFMESKYTNDLIQRLVDRILKDLFNIYPQVEGKIQRLELHGPFDVGLSQTPERFQAKGIRPESTVYQNLYHAGIDVTMNSFSGSIIGSWLAVNSIMGYNYWDYCFFQKNVTNDIASVLTNYCDYEEELLPLPLEEDNVETM